MCKVGGGGNTDRGVFRDIAKTLRISIGFSVFLMRMAPIMIGNRTF